MSLAAPRFEDRASFLIAGTHVVYTWSTVGEIPLQWQRFATIMDTIPGRIGTNEYGVNVDARKEGFEYLCGIEVSSSANLDRALVCVRMPAQRYVVFTHDAPLDTLRSTYLAIWNSWFPTSGYTATQAPNFEQYGADFDPETGSGPVEIWIGVNRRMTRAIARASYTEQETGVFELIVEARESGYALIHRREGADDTPAVAFSTGDELRAILPALPTASLSYAGARERLIKQWESDSDH